MAETPDEIMVVNGDDKALVVFVDKDGTADVRSQMTREDTVKCLRDLANGMERDSQ